MTSNNNN